MLLPVSPLFLLLTPACRTLFPSGPFPCPLRPHHTTSSVLQPGMHFLLLMTLPLVYHLYDIKAMGLSLFLLADSDHQFCRFLHSLTKPPCSISQAVIPISFRECRHLCCSHSNIRITALTQSFLRGHRQSKETCLSEDRCNARSACPIKLSPRGTPRSPGTPTPEFRLEVRDRAKDRERKRVRKRILLKISFHGRKWWTRSEKLISWRSGGWN